jgi:3-(3-hydroxy-phenyl)propionate hydroxylase
VNLQQYYAEAYLLARVQALPNIELRWHNSVTAVTQTKEQVRLTVNTPEGGYQLNVDYVLACDGSRSTVRKAMGLASEGRVFQDRFLIADVVLDPEAAKHFPSERWFWFDPEFHRDQSVLLHRQPDGVWRIDFQLGWDADPELEKQETRIRPRVDAMMRAALGHTIAFTLQWASVYTFACMRMDKFMHGRVLFAGDAAHGVSPFGARGANSGVQDADNLGWKLDAVLKGKADVRLLRSYGEEREFAADVNIGHSSRATDFLTPKNAMSQVFRNACLSLARQHDFARKLINTGRLSTATVMPHASLNTPDEDHWQCPQQLGMPALDAPWKDTWLLRHLHSCNEFTVLVYDEKHDTQGLFKSRYDASAGATYLFRPDQHLCARWRTYDASKIEAAIHRALAR